VRVDILERLADLIRPAIAYKPGVTAGDPPAGAADGESFVVTVAMTSLTGCSGEAFSSILKSLGYGATQRPGPAITVPLIAAAATEPLQPKSAGEEAVAEATPEAASEAPAPVEAVAEEAAPEAPIVAEAPAPIAEAEAAEAPETAAAEAVPAEGVEAAAPEAPATIEVWAPVRHAHAGGPRRQQGAPQQQRAPREGAEGERRGPRRDRPRQAEAAPAEGAPAGKPRFDKPRFDNPRFDKPRGTAPRDDRRGGRPGGYAPEKRERQPDPDSPFAKLAALKAELEKKGKA
ncbi:MAG: helicase, partial [Chloroflexota bacterium]